MMNLNLVIKNGEKLGERLHKIIGQIVIMMIEITIDQNVMTMIVITTGHILLLLIITGHILRITIDPILVTTIDHTHTTMTIQPTIIDRTHTIIVIHTIMEATMAIPIIGHILTMELDLDTQEGDLVSVLV